MANNNENKVIRHADKIKELLLEKEALQAKIEMIDSMLKTLDNKERQIIELRYFKDLTLDAIKETADRSTSSIKRIIKKVLKKFTEIYEKNQKWA